MKSIDENMVNAIQAVLSGQSQGSASKQFGVAGSSLNGWLKKVKTGEFVLPSIDNKKDMNEVNEVIDEKEPELMPPSDNPGGEVNVGNEETAVKHSETAGMEITSIASPVVCFHNCDSCMAETEDKIQKLNIDISSLKETAEQVPVLLDRLKKAESSAGSVELLKQRLETLDTENGRLQGEIFEVKKLSQAEEEKILSLEHTVYNLEAEKGALETKLDESTELYSALVEENQKSLTSSSEKNAEATAWKEKYENLIENGKKQIEELKDGWLKTNKFLEERAQAANSSLQVLLLEKEQFETEKIRIEDACTKTLKKYSVKIWTGRLLGILGIIGMPAMVILTIKILKLMGRLV